MTDRRASVLMWLGVWLAPVAWALHHAVGVELGLADCSPAGRRLWDIPLRGWSIAISVAAAVLATAGVVCAVLALRGTRDRGEFELPGARIRVMAIMAVTLAPLFLAIIVLDGLGTGLGDLCRQA